MKKAFSIIFAVLLLLSISIPCFAGNYIPDNNYVIISEVNSSENDNDIRLLNPALPRVIDEAEIISDSYEEMLLSELNRVGAKYQTDLIVLTVNSSDGKDLMDFADDYYDAKGYGYGENHTGTILVINIEQGNRGCWISTCGDDIDRINDYEIEELLDAFVPQLSSGDYDEAVMTYVNALEDQLEYEEQYGHDFEYDDDNDFNFDFAYDLYPEYSDTGERVLRAYAASIIVGLIIGVAVAYSLKKSMKPVKQAVSARNYLVSDSFRLTRHHDMYLYSNVTKTAKPKDSDTGSHSSGHSGGGGSHMSSGGVSHGGGGRSF